MHLARKEVDAPGLKIIKCSTSPQWRSPSRACRARKFAEVPQNEIRTNTWFDQFYCHLHREIVGADSAINHAHATLANRLAQLVRPDLPSFTQPVLSATSLAND